MRYLIALLLAVSMDCHASVAQANYIEPSLAEQFWNTNDGFWDIDPGLTFPDLFK